MFVLESSAQLDEERTAQTEDDKCSVPESASNSHHRGRTKLSRQKEKAISGVDGITSRKSRLGRYPLISTKPVSEANKQPQSISNGTLKRKREALVSKVHTFFSFVFFIHSLIPHGMPFD